jgi:serine/threonine protein kinase
VKVAALLEAKDRVIGDVKPENILVNEDGYVKVICQCSWPGQPSKFVRGWDRNSERLLLCKFLFHVAPEECEERQRKRQAMVYSSPDSCSEAFSIALTILEAGSLRDACEVYGDGHDYKFSELKVRELLDIFEDRYSRQLSEIVREMLHPSPRRRWRSTQVYRLLKPCEFQILNLEEIEIRLEGSLLAPRIER